VTGVVAGNNESFESLLKRFNKRVQQAGILSRYAIGNTLRSPVLSASERKQLRSVKLPEYQQGRK